MANENQSRENPSRQQTAERSQTGSAQQGTGAARGTPATGTTTGQGGREQTGGAMHTRRGASSITPYSSASSGYGGGPFSVMRRITDEMDRLFENFGMGRSLFPGESPQGGSWDAGSYGGDRRIDVVAPYRSVRAQRQDADPGGSARHEARRRPCTHRAGRGNYPGRAPARRVEPARRLLPQRAKLRELLPDDTVAGGHQCDSANATFRDGVLEIELDAPRGQQHGRTLEIRDAASSPGGSRAGTGSGATYGSQQASGTSGSQQSASGTSKGTNT